MRLKAFIFIIISSFTFYGQAPKKQNATEIFESIKKLNFLGKVLYVAAHPDDENTRLITYFSNYYHAETAYLSLTRGDGGQNLIGPELREKLGAIRTQELLAARKIDGGNQYFTRANDFGYSKEPNETFSIWNKQEVLEDVIQVMNTFQPDIVIHRFDHRTPGSTHGHHTASAILSLEAYEKLNHKPKRVFFNTSWWFYGSEDAFEKADKTNLIGIQANVFYPLKGKSNNEIAALSRSQHRCQGFGTTGSRGDEIEYLEILKGDLPPSSNLFEGIETSWNRIPEGEKIFSILHEVEKNFNFSDPSVHIPQLVKAYHLITQIKDPHWRALKSKQILSIIEASSGLFMEAISSSENITKNEPFSVAIEVINRSNAEIELLEYELLNSRKKNPNISLKNNNKITLDEQQLIIPSTFDYTNLFWLKLPATTGMYQVKEQAIRIYPENGIEFPILFKYRINEEEITFIKNIVFKKNDPKKGETYMPLTLLPEASTKLNNKVLIFNSRQPKEISVTIKSHKNNTKGTVRLLADENWKIEPSEIAFEINQKNEEILVNFKVTPPKEENTTLFKLQTETINETHFYEVTQIDYDHIPQQTLLQASEGKFVKLNIKSKGKNIAYIMGAGDEVGKNLENIGYQVTYLEPKNISLENLNQFDAVLLGIRAFNTIEELKYKNKELFEYVNQGGNLIVQYNTSSRLVTKEVSPYELTISRDRVTNENAGVEFINEKHPLLNHPNQISKKDFEGWIQEQGLYYPDKWSKEFSPIISSNDEGETPKKGAILVAKYGKGNYIYTGLSFFRELPEGVSGAYRLLVNMISLAQ